jgi:hypothetical protein
VAAPAAALDPVLVVLGDGDGDPRDLVLLIAVDHAEIARAGQVITALAAAFGEPILLRVRGVGPRQMRSRCPGLLAPFPLRPTPAAPLVRWCGLARIVVTRGRVRRVPRVPRQQMLQAGQLPGQVLVRRHKLRDLPGLARDDDDQLVTRHLFRLGHRKIKPQTTPSPGDRHAHSPNQARSAGLNVYRRR